MTFTLNQITNRAHDLIAEPMTIEIGGGGVSHKNPAPLIPRRWYWLFLRKGMIGNPRYQSSFYPSKKCTPSQP